MYAQVHVLDAFARELEFDAGGGHGGLEAVKCLVTQRSLNIKWNGFTSANVKEVFSRLE